jgi:hypothetical protein
MARRGLKSAAGAAAVQSKIENLKSKIPDEVG